MSSEPTRFDATTVIPARPTVYNGTHMRSRLEARYALWLDRSGIQWEYEPCAFAGGLEGQYLPDFRLHDVVILDNPRTVYVDVKPYITRDVDTILARMEVIWHTEPDAFLLVDAPGPDGISSPWAMLSYPAQLHFPGPKAAQWCGVVHRGQWKVSLARVITTDRWKIA